jgi:hypothetical protein
MFCGAWSPLTLHKVDPCEWWAGGRRRRWEEEVLSYFKSTSRHLSDETEKAATAHRLQLVCLEFNILSVVDVAPLNCVIADIGSQWRRKSDKTNFEDKGQGPTPPAPSEPLGRTGTEDSECSNVLYNFGVTRTRTYLSCSPRHTGNSSLTKHYHTATMGQARPTGSFSSIWLCTAHWRQTCVSVE